MPSALESWRMPTSCLNSYVRGGITAVTGSSVRA